MGLNIGLIIFGLVASGYGLTGRSARRAAAAPLGWILFVLGVLRAFVPNFF